MVIVSRLLTLIITFLVVTACVPLDPTGSLLSQNQPTFIFFYTDG